jgi:hypothetical protein
MEKDDMALRIETYYGQVAFRGLVVYDESCHPPGCLCDCPACRERRKNEPDRQAKRHNI